MQISFRSRHIFKNLKKIFICPGFPQKKPSAAGLKPLRFRSYAPVLFFFPAGGAAILSAPDTLRSSDGRWQPHNRCGGQYFPPGAVVCSHSQSGFRYPKNVTVRISHPFFTGNAAADRLSRRLGIQKKQIVIT